MQKILGLIFFLTMFGLFYSCTQNANDTVNKTEAEKEARQVIFALGMIPDSLRSPEQKALAKNLEIIFYEHCLINNNRMEIAIGEKELKAMGVPKIYYEILKKEVEDLNHYLDTMTSVVFAVDSMMMDAFRKSQSEYFNAKE